MDELKELHLDISFVSELKEQLNSLIIRKLVLKYTMKEHVDLKFLMKHKTCKQIIIYSPFEKEIIHLQEQYPTFTIVFNPELLPLSQQLASKLVDHSIYLSQGYLRLCASELTTELSHQLHELYLPSYTIHNCQEDTILLPSFKIEIDTCIPSTLFSISNIISCSIFEKIKPTQLSYDFSSLYSLQSLQLLASENVKRVIKLPQSIKRLKISGFIQTTKDISFSNGKKFEDISFDYLSLSGCEIVKIKSTQRNVEFISCTSSSKILFHSLESISISYSTLKYVSLPENVRDTHEVTNSTIKKLEFN